MVAERSFHWLDASEFLAEGVVYFSGRWLKRPRHHPDDRVSL